MADAAGVAAGEQRVRRAGLVVVAGLRLTAELPLRGCSEGRPIAGRLRIGAAAGPPGSGFVDLPGEPGSAWMRLDGRWLLLRTDRDWGARARRLVPYASWLQGLPLLHAACVERDGAALALVGASGAGKSTLARRLERLGWRVLCDDLTPCRGAAGAALVPRSARRAAPLRAVVFLRRRHGRRPRLGTLPAAMAVAALARHGWGDLALRELWRAQFDFYARLAASCPAFRLSMRDDATRPGEAAGAAARLLARRV